MADGSVSGAPPSEMGPIEFGWRAIFLRTREYRLADCFAEMEAVTSEAITLFSESTLAVSAEIWPEIFFTS